MGGWRRVDVLAGGRADGGAGGLAWTGERGGRGKGWVGAAQWGGGEEDLHVDASAVVGEFGQLVRAGGGANDQLGRGVNWIVVRPAHVCFVVARGGHDHNLRFVKVWCV